MDSFANLFREPFQFFTTILLSLLFPLSFLIISRLSVAHYLIDFVGYSKTEISNNCDLLIKFFLQVNPIFLHVLVSIISVAALSHTLTGGTSCFIKRTPEPVSRLRLYTAWFFVCILQICVGLGIEGAC